MSTMSHQLEASRGLPQTAPDLAWWEGDDNHNMDAWETESAFEAFGESRLGPAMAKLGINVAPEVTFHPAHEVFAPQVLRLTM